MATQQAERIEFKAEIQQVLDILIHSLYTEKDIFLRELISNASDALNRFKLESLKSQDVLDPDRELAIWIDTQDNTLRIHDSGIGMSQSDMVEFLGTIAHSGAKAFIESMKEINKGSSQSTHDVIGQFGVGFYSVFMVAEEVKITSRSFKPEEKAAFWRSKGQGSYEVGEAEKDERGTLIEITLKDDAKEFAEPTRLRQIIKTHSDFVAFPIYIKETKDDKDEWVQANAQTALWREPSQSVGEEQYTSFYQQLSFDFNAPLKTIHFQADMPIQFYALLFVPSRRDHKAFRNGDDYGLKLYARKVLIQEKFKDLLPPYLRFIEGVVDSEDLPLNVSREAVQATPTIARIRKALIGRFTTELERMAKNEPEDYLAFYKEFGFFLKEGIASDPGVVDKFKDLLRFYTSKDITELVSLSQYIERMKEDQKEIYYVLGDSVDVVSQSNHLEYFRKNDIEVLFLTDPMDSFMLMSLQAYQDKPLKNIDDAELDLPETEESKIETPKSESFISLTAFVKQVLGERIEDVKESKLLTDSAARLVSPTGSGASSFYRVQKLMGQEVTVPKKILELNPKSELIQTLSQRLTDDDKDPLLPVLIEQIYENELLAEGLHPNPAEMLPRLQKLLSQAAKR